MSIHVVTVSNRQQLETAVSYLKQGFQLVESGANWATLHRRIKPWWKYARDIAGYLLLTDVPMSPSFSIPPAIQHIPSNVDVVKIKISADGDG